MCICKWVGGFILLGVTRACVVGRLVVCMSGAGFWGVRVGFSLMLCILSTKVSHGLKDGCHGVNGPYHWTQF